MPLIKVGIFVIIVIVLLSRNTVSSKLTDVIHTDKGPVQGEIVATVQDANIEYSAFRAIPYAKPPVGPLRFQPPVESDNWSEILIVTTEAPLCPQISLTGYYEGVENCLYLNVYTPLTTFNASNNELLAVMVWIYGGIFLLGDIGSKIYGPDFLVAENVVIVNMNYRLGALGFLSLDIPEATGNMGLKDQVLALKWVQKNIEKFGGDPNKVTIFGQSAGSVSVLLHQISPASNGLFRSAIAMSGSPLNRWGFNPLSLEISQAFDVSTRLQITNYSKKQLFQTLLHTSAEELVRATNDMIGSRINLLHFTPTFETPGIAKDIFLSECPLKSYKSGNFTDVPVMLGFTDSETLLFTIIYADVFRLANTARQFFQSFSSKTSTIDQIINSILSFYEKIMNFLIKAYFYIGVQTSSDVSFVAGIDITQKYLVKNSKSPVYYYRNSFTFIQRLTS